MATGRIPTTANSPLTAKGDLFTFSTGSAKLAVGNNGETLVADSSTSTGLAYREDYAAGKNKIINGDFGIWQRGTAAFTVDGAFTTDRWYWNQGVTASAQVTQGTFTPAELSVPSGITNFYTNIAGTITNAATGYIQFAQKIEDVRTLQNTTATISFYAKGSAAGTINIVMRQNFGSGGSAAVLTTPVNFTLTTSWARYSTTVSIPSVSGKTIGASSSLELIIVKNMGSNYPTFGTANYTGTLSLWGIQVEEGSVATAFNTATGTLQGELAACQRYYFKTTTGRQGVGYAKTTTVAELMTFFPVEMRTAPSALEQTGTAADYLLVFQNSATACSAVPTFENGNKNNATTRFTVASGLTAGNGLVSGSNSGSSYLAWSTEL